jgi:hypothetical protein
MRKIKLKDWVETTLFIWLGVDIGLIALALYMQRLFELGLN